MNGKRNFLQTLTEGRILFFDGGLGTMLQAKGLPPGVSPELFSLERPEIVHAVHSEYALAGADILTTNTFGGNSFKLPDGVNATDFNRRMAELARHAADTSGRLVFVAGSIGPSGKFLRPLGELSFEELAAAYTEQIRGLVQGGVDLLQVETQFDLTEARAVVAAARRICDLPISVSMTYENCLTLTGSTPEICSATLANLGVDIIAANCSAGPEEMREVAERLLAASPAPVLLQPNAGLPELLDGQTVFRLGPEKFAALTAAFARMGAKMLGGCCGTTPAHIRALKDTTRTLEAELSIPAAAVHTEGRVCLSSRSRLVNIGAGAPLCFIGERINPTGKKAFSAELAAGELNLAMRYAAEQLEAGVPVLDVNVGAALADEEALLPLLVAKLAAAYEVPLSLDSAHIGALKAALEVCPASSLINSISGEEGKLEHMGPLCLDFGAPFILLPLKGGQLPERAADRIKILEALLEKAESLRIPRRLMLVDCLALAVSSQREAAIECLSFIRYCSEHLKLPTVIGLSNVSFGLPARELLNAHFLTLAAGAGLSACIANPSNLRVREAAAAADLLLGRDADAAVFIPAYADWKPHTEATGHALHQARSDTGKFSEPEDALKQVVLQGLREAILPLLEGALAAGRAPLELITRELIPAITEVGARYERREYFLPQLLRSAETMQTAMAHLQPLLKEDDAGAAKKCRVVMATVEGDIHDIGKNIVNLMLNNHGFEVIDLGKDVKASAIVDAAISSGACLIGLSALMTTTMVRMRDTIELLRERGLEHIQVMVGGAVVTAEFAASIGAHGFARDAVEAVRVAGELSGG